jgi:carboxypeptidase Taq
MTENTPYQQLTRTFQRLSRFSHLAAIAGWDMFAMMPPGGSAAAKRWRARRAAASDPDR